jgi:hypothetical protein
MSVVHGFKQNEILRWDFVGLKKSDWPAQNDSS